MGYAVPSGTTAVVAVEYMLNIWQLSASRRRCHEPEPRGTRVASQSRGCRVKAAPAHSTGVTEAELPAPLHPAEAAVVGLRG